MICWSDTCAFFPTALLFWIVCYLTTFMSKRLEHFVPICASGVVTLNLGSDRNPFAGVPLLLTGSFSDL